MKYYISSKRSLLIAGSLLVIMLAVAAYYALNWTDDRLLTTVEYNGIELINEREIDNIIAPFIGEEFGSLDLSSLKSQIDGLSYVLSSEVYRSGFESLAVEITESVPVAYNLSDNGELSVLSATGKLLELRSLGNKRHIPVYRSVFSARDSAQLVEAAAIIRELESREEMRMITSEILYLGKGQYSIRSTHKDVSILIGDIEKIKEKTDRLIAFWKNYLVSHDSGLENIDLRWGDKIIMY
jgi:cell division septal protein FtsQ